MPSLADFPVDAIGDVFRTNAGAPLAFIQSALPLLRASARGAVVNITPTRPASPYEGWGLYGASKAALEQLTAVFATEEPGVRFWAFDPGDMRTQMHQDAFPGEDISDRPLPEEVAVPAFVAPVVEPTRQRFRARQRLARGGRVMTARLAFDLPPALEAHGPPESRRLSRDGVRMMVASRSTGSLTHPLPQPPRLPRHRATSWWSTPRACSLPRSTG